MGVHSRFSTIIPAFETSFWLINLFPTYLALFPWLRHLFAHPFVTPISFLILALLPVHGNFLEIYIFHLCISFTFISKDFKTRSSLLHFIRFFHILLLWLCVMLWYLHLFPEKTLFLRLCSSLLRVRHSVIVRNTSLKEHELLRWPIRPYSKHICGRLSYSTCWTLF